MDIPCCYTHLQGADTDTTHLRNIHGANTVIELICETLNQRTELGVEVAFRHLGHVVFMEKLALVSLLAQSSEPVLTHHRLLSTDVTIRTHPT